jgi:dTDP-4-dehydrorhamnose reductase
MRVLVLGHRGMLGHVVVRTLQEAGMQVRTLEERYSKDGLEQYRSAIRDANADWCVNCVGIGPGRGMGRDTMVEANMELPLVVSRACGDRARLIHASTDGVFLPDKPDRLASEIPDATDHYGMGKFAGEDGVVRAGGIAFRCSIIGPEAGTARSLLQWLVHQRGDVRGYTNQAWNGITTRAWAKLALEFITGQRTERGVIQPGFWPPISKCELLRAIAREWGLPVTIVEHAAPQPVVRTLRPTILLPPIEEQLRELHAWYGPLDARAAA